MINTLRIITYKELGALSDVALVKCVEMALEQLNKTVKRGEDTLQAAQIHRAYDNELAKRKFSQRIR